jgi:ABC-2 type transport system ATP-binding protein
VKRLEPVSIHVSELTKLYGEQKALDAVSFDLPDHQIVGLLGPNGAGKSTLMKILTGYLPADAGNAQVCGLPVGTDALAVKQKIGYLPEHNPLYTDLYVAEYLQFVAGLYGAPTTRVEEMIQQTGLTPERHKTIGQLSKGYRQRVGLAAALLHDPEVLILDEPTTGLDPNQLVEIRGLIKRVGQSKTVVLSTHILQEVEHMCDRVLIIHHGRIVRDATLAELQADGGLEKAFRTATQA